MARLDYANLINPFPVCLMLGTIRKPKLAEIFDPCNGIGYETFSYFEFILMLDPETYFCKLRGEQGKTKWDAMTNEEKDNQKLYDIIINDDELKKQFLDVFNFFFMEKVIFAENVFLLLKDKNAIDDIDKLTTDDLKGYISADSFDDVLSILRQICCISDDDHPAQSKFKNKIAEELFKKISRGQKQKEKSDKKFSIPNIISAVSNKHPTISPITVYDLTIFQLMDCFARLQSNTIYEIESLRVAVWGDEKKTFNAENWYKFLHSDIN